MSRYAMLCHDKFCDAMISYAMYKSYVITLSYHAIKKFTFYML